LLRTRTKYDFHGYSRDALQRRIKQRMGLQHVDGINGYVDFLRTHPLKVDRLKRDLLSGGAAFFRDPRAYDELAATALAGLVHAKDPGRPIRVWVPGCSTGEEAYSIAMLLAEQSALGESASRTQIFATDMDTDALLVARAGRYPASIALDVKPERLRRFFVPDDYRYKIKEFLREAIIFGVVELDVHSELGRGSAFSLLLPAGSRVVSVRVPARRAPADTGSVAESGPAHSRLPSGRGRDRNAGRRRHPRDARYVDQGRIDDRRYLLGNQTAALRCELSYRQQADQCGRVPAVA
jgi:chemotaxis methyl-accepting protein methylase